jgi:hypothetical protein
MVVNLLSVRAGNIVHRPSMDNLLRFLCQNITKTDNFYCNVFTYLRLT